MRRLISVWVVLPVLAPPVFGVAASFRSAWDTQPDAVWLGPAYWANPLQDWRVARGRLECVGQGPDRTVHLLTYQATADSTLTLRVRIGRRSPRAGAWAGFRVGIHDRLLDYRHNCIYGQGLDAGITVGGDLLLGRQRCPVTWAADAVELELRVLAAGPSERRLVLTRLPDGPELSLTVPAARIAGNLALVSHVPGKVRRDRPSFWFSDWRVRGESLAGGPAQDWGPILWTQYTVSRGMLKLSAQFPPIGTRDSHEARLELRRGDRWRSAATASIDAAARVALFRVTDWDATGDVPYRVVYTWRARDHVREGTIRRDPVDRAALTVAGFTGNKDYAFPNREIVRNVRRLDPDLLFFSGDQIYEDVGRFGVTRAPLEVATLDYLRKYWLFGWAFGDLLADRPSVILPDDHDVYQGNIWGNGGTPPVDGGGYTMDPAWVNMVQRTQTAHLPDPVDPRPVARGIGVYFTELCWGRVSFAVLEDRKFKSGPRPYQAGERDANEAVLLGERQLRFLRDWAADWRGADFKCALSQTVFAQCHTFGGKGLKPLRHSYDSNGWPPRARNRALAEIRRGFAFMLAGDNHLPTVVHHGIDTWEDAGVSFTTPSIAAGFPRAWWPAKAGLERQPGTPDDARARLADGPAYLGRYRSPFGHPITFLAAANPQAWIQAGQTPPGDIAVLDRKASGFALVRFDKPTRRITAACYRIAADLDRPAEAQFADWPVVIDQTANYGRAPVAWLPELRVAGQTDPVVQVVAERDDEIVYTLRIRGDRFRPWVFAPGAYTLRVGEPDRDRWCVRRHVSAGPQDDDRVLNVSLVSP